MNLRRTPGGVVAFIPPPAVRTVAFDAEIVAALLSADRSLGELSGVGKRLRNPTMLTRPYLRTEAVLSSRIEGTQSSLSELLLFEADASADRPTDASEVFNRRASAGRRALHQRVRGGDRSSPHVTR